MYWGSKSTSAYDIGQYLKNLLVFSYPSNFTLLIRPSKLQQWCNEILHLLMIQFSSWRATHKVFGHSEGTDAICSNLGCTDVVWWKVAASQEFMYIAVSCQFYSCKSFCLSFCYVQVVWILSHCFCTVVSLWLVWDMHWNKLSCMTLACVGLGECSDVNLVMLQFQIQKYSYKCKWIKTDRIIIAHRKSR
jgi:hypothetical protein